MAAFDLLIFDLDGTLVPTEQLAIEVVGPLMRNELGVAITDEEVGRRYHGRDLEYQYADMAALYGAELPASFFTLLNATWLHAVEERLRPSEGATDALDALHDVARCIASNNYADGIALTMKATGLSDYFDTIVCSDDVEFPKPAPDMFLLAARRFDTDPSRCLVIEDSLLGVQAGIAAGMATVGYTGNLPDDGNDLRDAGAHVIHHFNELVGVVRHGIH